MKPKAIAGLALSIFFVACGNELPTSVDEVLVERSTAVASALPSPTPCNGSGFSASCEVAYEVPPGSLICNVTGCPTPSLPAFNGINTSGVPSHVVVDNQGDFFVVRSDFGQSGDLVKIIPGVGGIVHGGPFAPVGLGFDPVSDKFYMADANAFFKNVRSITRAADLPLADRDAVFYGPVNTSSFRGGAVAFAGNIFVTQETSGGGFILQVRGQPNLSGPGNLCCLGKFPSGITVDGSGFFFVNGTGGGIRIPPGHGYVTRVEPITNALFHIILPDGANNVDGDFFDPKGNPAVTSDGKIVVTSIDPPRVLLLEAGATSGTGTASTIHTGSPLITPSGAALTPDGQDILVIDESGTLFRISGALNSPPVADAGPDQTVECTSP